VDFQDIIFKLDRFWARQGCSLLPPGAAGLSGAVPLCLSGAAARGLPPDGLPGLYRYRVLLRPAPSDVRRLFLNSLKEAGIDRSEHDLRWLSAEGGPPGWQVLLDGLPLADFRYLEPPGGREAAGAEVGISLERLAMVSQRKKSAADLAWSGRLTYGSLHAGEVE
jgi:glycyl-tRNA synthetase alpha chain